MGEINVENEATLELLRSLYAGWPGHAQHYEKAAAEALRIALARTPRNRFFVVRNLLRAMETEGPAAGLERSAAQWTELAWQRRDQDAPEGNPLRATYLTNLARFWRSTDNNEHFAEALTLAEAALPYSARAAVVRATLRALRDRTEE